MAGLEDLAALLLRDEDSYKTENPFYAAGSGLLGASVQPINAEVSPWERLLLGALAGFGGGVLQGVGKSQADADTSTKVKGLVDLLSTELPAERKAIIQSNPELGKYNAVLEISEAAEKKALTDYAKKKQLEDIADALSGKAPMRTRYQGTQEIQEQRTYDPESKTFSWTTIGQGPRFKPTPDSVTINAEKNEVPEGVRSLFAEKLAKALGMSADDPRVSAASGDYRNIRMLSGLDAAEEIGTRAAASRADKIAEGSIFGYEPVREGAGRLGQAEAGKYREKAALTGLLVNQLATMAEGDLGAVTGLDAAKQKALAAEIFNALRQRTGSGAALSPAESEMIRAMMPVAASGDLVGALKAGLLKRNQKDLAKYMQERFADDLDYELLGLGLRRSTRPLDSYPAEMLQRYGLSATPQPAAAGPVPGATPAASPTQTPPPNGQMRVTLKDGGTATWDGQGYRRD